MLSRLAKFSGGAISLALITGTAGGLASPAPAAANQPPNLPWYTDIVPGSNTETWSQEPDTQLTGPTNVMVHINMAPLAMVGKFWTHQERLDYVAKIRAEQDAIIPQIEAMGGTIVGRFTQASTGLGVSIDRSRVDDLKTLGNVIAVNRIADYQLDLTETVPFIGGTTLQELGLTGKHPWTGAGIDVAVIDSGVDYTHVKMGGPGTEAAYAEAYCGDASIAVDPTNPACNAHTLSADPALFGPGNKVAGGHDWVGERWPIFSSTIEPDANPIDIEGHGTHVADIIGGLESAPGMGDQGVAPDVNIWAFKACSAVASSCNGLALLLAVDDALDLDNSDYGACTPLEDEGCTTFDPADVINMSLGSSYGQPEDDLTHFANIASYYGSVVVASAGNSADKPYIVGSPSAAAGAISVAQSTVPSDRLYKVTLRSATVGGLLQPWSAPISDVSGALEYDTTSSATRFGCSNANGDNPWVGQPLMGKVVLMDRGTCAVSRKVANAEAAGAALAIVANNQFSNTPPSFSFGGGDITISGLTITQNEGSELKAILGQTASVAPSSFIALPDDIVASSSRGPRIADGAIKPDIAAPGASISAIAGSGDGKSAFGGTSGAAPMVSGAAALMAQALEERGILRDANPGVVVPGISVANLVKAMLMNTANPNTYIGGSALNDGSGFLAPITLQGAGRVDALAAYNSGTVALDVTDLYNWIFDPSRETPCTVSTPPTNALTHQILPEFYNGSYECLTGYPYGNDFFNAWNAATGSISFGYDGVSALSTETRKVFIANFGTEARTYNLSTAFRYDDDRNRGVSVTIEPSSITVPGQFAGLVDVTIEINAEHLRDWYLSAGANGASGTNIYCSDPAECPTLTAYEYDGFLTIDGGADNVVRMPWQVLPRKAAANYVSSHGSRTVTLRNAAQYKSGDVDVFALFDQSVNNCEVVDSEGNCIEPDYVPGILPGINSTAIDLKEVGLRDYVVSGINAAFGLPAAPYGEINDQVIDFALTVHDKPYRASQNYPVGFEIRIDSNNDGTLDYIVFNADQARGTDGRNMVFVQDVNPADGTRATRPYLYADTCFNSQNWILPVPAAAIGLVNSQQFAFRVLAYDNYFTARVWDASPFDGGFHTFTLGTPKYRSTTTAFHIRTEGSYRLHFAQPSAGAVRSPSQIGLLFMYRDAEEGRESDSVILD